MDTLEKVQYLTSQMELEPDSAPSPNSEPVSARPSCFTPQSNLTQKQKDAAFIQPAQLPNGGQILLLKTLLSSACERDCYYCPFRARRNFRRATFKPQEFAETFIKLNQSRAAEGLFLSSGIAGGGVRTQDKILDTADILRNKFKFRGYIHLKIMPGAEKAQVERAMQLADRVSINLEAPNPERLSRLAPHKQFLEELLRPLRWAEEIRQTQPSYKGWNHRWPSTVTQFVAGGADESDIELLTTTEWLIKNLRIKRAYYSAFFPIHDTPLENKAPTDPMREHRLYQASFLLRDYGFTLEDMSFTTTGNLPLASDPKLAWAQIHLADSPLEVNQAEKSQLIRVPGIGLKGADEIIKARRVRAINELSTLKKLGIQIERASPYILMNGKKEPAQLNLFP